MGKVPGRPIIANLTISNVNDVYVKVACDQGISYELKEYFTFQVPGYNYHPLYKARVWDGKIRLWDSKLHTIYRGLIPHISLFCEERNYTWDYDNGYDDEFSLVEAQEFIRKLNPSLEPRDYQIKAFVDSIRIKRALLRSPTSSGKSLIAYLLINKLLSGNNKKGLIIVPTIQLVEQLYKDFQDYSSKNKWDVDKYVHRIYGGKDKDTPKPITISTWQSLHTLDKAYFEQFDFVLGDECHLFKAKSLTAIMENLINTTHRIGMTGTLDGSHTHRLVLEGLFGGVREIITTAELMEKKHVADFHIKCLVLKHSSEEAKAISGKSYIDEMHYLISHPARNRFIVNLALSLPTNTLILYQFVEGHGRILMDLINNQLKDTNRKCFFIHGGVDVDEREEVRKIVETEKDAIIIASSGTFSTGINIKNLHNVIFASPSKSRIRNLQSIGRALRISDTKSSAILFDIADDLTNGKHTNFTLKHFALRLQIYASEKFKYKIYRITLKS